METKITLKLNDSVLEKAKEYARSHNISLSTMIERYLKAMVSDNDIPSEQIEISPRVKELSGVIKLPPNYDYKQEYGSYLEKKYQ